jgi:hypothetical protein
MTRGLAYTYQSLANLYKSQRDYKKSENNYLKANNIRLVIKKHARHYVGIRANGPAVRGNRSD